ncbi:MAG: OmpA family protein [Coxiellaceae bacterium]|nr:MAG: OmpA family protein [Coxiellaceae bacterium]
MIKTGETYSIIIFNDTIFNTDSSNFSANSNRVLEPLTGLLKFYETVSIRISGFSDNSSTVRRGIALSGRQAERLGDYLAEQGLDARMIYAVGYGPALPVASNATPEGRAKNRRMVIKFRYIVIPVERYDY